MKRIFIIVAVIILISLGGTACSQKAENTDAENTNPAEEPAKQTIDAFGIVKAQDEENIIMDVPARISGIFVKDGQKIAMGDPIMTIDMSDYISDIEMKKISLNNVQEDLDILESEKFNKEQYIENSSDPEIKSLENDRKATDEKLNAALKEMETKESLYGKGAISEQEINDFRSSIKDKQDQLKSLDYSIESYIEKSRQELDELKKSILAKRHEVAVLIAEIDEMYKKLDKSYIKDSSIVSDADEGIVCNIENVCGDMLSAGSRAATIIKTDMLFIEAEVSEQFIKDVEENAGVTIKPLADETREYHGNVTYISDIAVNNSGETNVLVEISISDRDDFILPGFNVEVAIDMENQENTNGVKQ